MITGMQSLVVALVLLGGSALFLKQDSPRPLVFGLIALCAAWMIGFYVKGYSLGMSSSTLVFLGLQIPAYSFLALMQFTTWVPLTKRLPQSLTFSVCLLVSYGLLLSRFRFFIAEMIGPSNVFTFLAYSVCVTTIFFVSFVGPAVVLGYRSQMLPPILAVFKMRAIPLRIHLRILSAATIASLLLLLLWNTVMLGSAFRFVTFYSTQFVVVAAFSEMVLWHLPNLFVCFVLVPYTLSIVLGEDTKSWMMTLSVLLYSGTWYLQGIEAMVFSLAFGTILAIIWRTSRNLLAMTILATIVSQFVFLLA